MKRIWAIAFIILTSISLTACAGQKAEEAYQFTGETDFKEDDRSFQLEDVPNNAAQELVINDFLYTITAEFEKKTQLFAEIDKHAISIQNEGKNFDKGCYIKSYQIHRVSTLTKEEYSQEKLADGKDNPYYEYGWEDGIKNFGLTEYQIIAVDFTQTLSEKAQQGGPQWGDGRYQRNYLVGKTEKNQSLKIYDLGVMKCVQSY